MKKLTKILTVSLAAISLMACDDVVAQPNAVLNGEVLVHFANNETYFNNNFEVIYNDMVASGTSNSTILTELTNLISKKEVKTFYGFSDEEMENIFTNVTNSLSGKDRLSYSSANQKVAENLEAAIIKRVKDTMVDKAKSDSYAVDNLFQERKLVNELRTSLYEVEGDVYNEDYLITPDSEFEDIFFCDYTDYIKKTIFPEVYKELLTSVYLYNKNYSALGRAYAREVKYIKLENISNHTDSVSVLINNYFKAFVENTTPTGDFDLYSLARIYKGVFTSEDTDEVSLKEKAFVENNDITTREDTIMEELRQVVKFDDSDAPTDQLLDENDRNRDSELISSYTGSYAYLPSWGRQLKEREIEQLDIIVDDGIAIKSNGVSDLPTEFRNRLFSSSVSSYVKTLNGVTFLTPKVTPNGSVNDYLTQYAYYDSSTNAYYIAIVGATYNTTKLNDHKDSAETKEVAMEIARILGKTSTNQKEALVYYLDKYDMSFGDQDFYDYIESTYSEVLDDNYTYGKED